MIKTSIVYRLDAINQSSDCKNSFQKINDYLISFVGDLEIKKENDVSSIIYYIGTPMTARMTLLEKNGQITVSVSSEDNLTINLINNVASSVGFRIFNSQTKSYLLNNANIFDLTTVKIEPMIKYIFKEYDLTPLFQYRDSLIFFGAARDKSIHLINRHLLEHLISHPHPTSKMTRFTKEFSVKIADNISQFVALFDRGLIPISFYKYLSENSKVLNLSGLNIDKLYTNILVFPVYFNFDEKNQSFIQTEISSFPNKIEIKKNKSIIKTLNFAKYTALKIAGDVSYQEIDKKLIPKISVSVFLS